jgi:hypothetical protein
MATSAPLAIQGAPLAASRTTTFTARFWAINDSATILPVFPETPATTKDMVSLFLPHRGPWKGKRPPGIAPMHDRHA